MMIKLLLIVLAIYIVAFGLLYSFQESLIFQSDTLEKDHTFRFDTPFEEETIKRKDGAKLHGLHFKADKPQGMIIYFHGNAGDLSRWGEIVEPFVSMGYDVLAIDYRGYGKSKGKRKEAWMYEDALEWFDLGLQYFDASSITLYGRSLGCTFAAFAAAKRRAHQLILETPFYSLRSVVKNTYSLFPVNNLLKYRFPTHEFIDQVRCPITILHGTEDDIVPIENGKRLMEHNLHIQFIVIHNGEHNNLASFDEYWQNMERLLPSIIEIDD